MNNWSIWPIDRDLNRCGDPIHGWEKLDIIERDTTPSIVEITAPTSALGNLLSPDMGIILDDPDGQQIFSGQLSYISGQQGTTANGESAETVTLIFEDFYSLLWNRIVWPEPSRTLTDGQVTQLNGTHDKRSGKLETTIKDMIQAQTGALAQAARIDPRLYVPPTTNAGPQVTFESRFGILGEVITQTADQNGYRIKIMHDESTGKPRLKLDIVKQNDRSDTIIFGANNQDIITGYISDYQYQLGAPKATIAIIAAQGEMEDRQIIAIGPDHAAEQQWGYRREMLVDQRQADANSASGQAEAIANGRARLAEAASPVSIGFTVTDGPDIKYRRDYNLGDTVSITLPGRATRKEKIREVRTIIENGTDTRRIVVGAPGATENSTAQAIDFAAALKRLRNLERN